MRKILISVLVVLLLIGSAFFMVNGIDKLNIKGIKGLSEKNEQVDQKISDLSNVISVTYVNTESNLKRTANTLQETKTEYENQAALSDTQNPSYASQLETYDIDYLWTRLGNYARDENVVIKIDLVASGTSKNLYNLNFATEGEYINITNFIYEIENDSKLGFKIDEFKMSGGALNGLSATFTCKEIPINVGTIDQASSSSSGNESSSGTAGTSGAAGSSGSTGSTSNTTSGTAGSNTTSTTTTTTTTTNTSTSSSSAGSTGAGNTAGISTQSSTNANATN